MPDRLVKWLVFSGAVALVPVLFAAIFSYLEAGRTRYPAILGNGELFVISVGLCAAAIGDLIDKGSGTAARKRAALLVGGAAVMIVIMASLLFAVLTYGPLVDARRVAHTSIVVYFSALFVGASSILIVEA